MILYLGAVFVIAFTMGFVIGVRTE